MENDEGKFVDLYVPRKCSATGRLIGAKDHGSIQLNVGEVDALGHYHGKYSTFAICGYLRKRGESDSCLNRLFHERGLLSFSQ
ncbi:uncharacterized protein LOC128883489 [Hylaeus volcanicus]|uniref:uncharacterized protein LOC128883489 n=1 Tax=Hylaeus volcanicus TaxID=313075 RepID=UPI0023B7CC7B|nr:uncharacterized protein LOC128883489 [Hylaeus volcanicus]